MFAFRSFRRKSQHDADDDGYECECQHQQNYCHHREKIHNSVKTDKLSTPSASGEVPRDLEIHMEVRLQSCMQSRQEKTLFDFL